MADKTFFITTPIYYVNGKPHVGHAYTTIAADTAARWQRLKRGSAFLLTGTDEHGQKVLQKANERGMTPTAHVNDMVVHWHALRDTLRIEYDRFIRTTDADHIATVQDTLQDLHDKGELYEASYTGWYSPAAERFWTEKDLVDGKCPDTGMPVEEVKETNWFFRMGKYKERLVAHIHANPGYIRPESRRNEVLGFLDKPLEDLCISRPKSRMGWGIEIPFARDYVTYVWFDALLNYVTASGWRPGTTDESWKKLWPADFHLVGKDILTTHAVYWSTMLMACGLPLPGAIYAHGWWLSADGDKMSKSKGNVIDVDLLVRSFGVDAVRFYLLREIAFGADGKFSYEGYLNRYNADLANDLGNLSHRALSMTCNWLGGVVPAVEESTGNEEAILALAADVVTRFDAAMDALQFQDATGAVFDLVRAGNKYIDTTAPWALNKAGDVAKLRTVLRTTLEITYLSAALLSCVMPDKMGELIGKLGRTPALAADDVRAWLAAAPTLRSLPASTPLTLGDPLFPRFREMPAEIAALFTAPQESPVETKPEAPVAAPVAAPAPAPKKEIAEAPAEIQYEDFAKVKLRVGKILSAEKHPKANRLLILQVDIGEEKPRQILAGIAEKYTAEQVLGRTIIVVANLAPRKMMGMESQGMLLAASLDDALSLVTADIGPGASVK